MGHPIIHFANRWKQFVHLQPEHPTNLKIRQILSQCNTRMSVGSCIVGFDLMEWKISKWSLNISNVGSIFFSASLSSCCCCWLVFSFFFFHLLIKVIGAVCRFFIVPNTTTIKTRSAKIVIYNLPIIASYLKLDYLQKYLHIQFIIWSFLSNMTSPYCQTHLLAYLDCWPTLLPSCHTVATVALKVPIGLVHCTHSVHPMEELVVVYSTLLFGLE